MIEYFFTGGVMKTNLKATLLRLSKKKLNVFDIVKLYKILLELPYNDITFVKLFLNNYYSVAELSDDFYRLFLYCVHSNKYKELFDVLLTRNIYDLISLLKIDYINLKEMDDVISPIDYFNLPTKQIRFITKLIKSLDIQNDEIRVKKLLATNALWLLRKPCINTEDEYTKIAIKMFMSVGLDNSIDILCGKYGEIDYDIVYFLFNNFNVREKKTAENLLFNDFLFNNKKAPNNNMRLMLEGNFLELFINFDYFYNSIEFFIEKLGTKFNKAKVSILLKERYLAPRLENPELSGDILDDMVSSYYHKYGVTDNKSEIIDKNIEAYNLKLKTKTKSSIIQTDIPKDGEYIFELLSLTDARNLVMGYRAGNCFRINGDAFVLFNNFLTNPHMCILSISTEEYKDFGMVLLMRNGNVLIAQGIELSKRVPNQIIGEKLYNSVKKAVNYIMNQMNNGNNEIVASIIGLSNNNTAPYNRNILPFIVNPILDNNHQFYNGIDNYQGLLSLKEGKTINDIKLYVPSAIYCEKNNIIYRRDISTSHNSIEYREIEKILISLRYARFKSTPKEELIYYYSDLSEKRELYTICTLDWFIMVFQDGTIDTFINSNNPTIVEKYYLELEKIKSKKNMIK